MKAILITIGFFLINDVLVGQSGLSNTTNHKLVLNSKEWLKVKIVSSPKETENMVRLGLVAIKAKGKTIFNSAYQPQNESINKIKQIAAMLGGNVVLMTDKSLQTGLYRKRSARGRLTGVVYRSEPFDTVAIQQNLTNKSFLLLSKTIVGSRSKRIKYKTPQFRLIKIGEKLDGLRIENGLIALDINIDEPQKTLYIVSHSTESFTAVYQFKERFYELIFGVWNPNRP